MHLIGSGKNTLRALVVLWAAAVMPDAVSAGPRPVESIRPAPESQQASSQRPSPGTPALQGPFFVFNALWFNPGGEATYEEYFGAARPILESYGGEIQSFYTPLQTLQGDFDAHRFGVVKWPDLESFRRFVQDPEFQELRTKLQPALAKNWVVISRQAPSKAGRSSGASKDEPR